MLYRQLGKNGLMVSAVCLGTNTFGDQVDEAQTVEIIGRAIDGRIKFNEIRADTAC